MLIALALTTLATLAWTAFLLRLPIRERNFERRRARIGEQQWYEVVQESGRKGGPYNASAFEGVRMIAQFLNSYTLTNVRDRGRITFAWVRSSTDKSRLTHLYVGINANAGESGLSALRGYAKSIGARVEPVVHPIDFPANNMVIARRDRAVPMQAKGAVSEIGVVAAAVASVADTSGCDNAAVYITLDGMGRTERAMTTEALMTQVAKDANNNALFASKAVESVSLMGDGPVRMSIAAANNGGDIDTSKALLSSAVTSTASLGYGMATEAPKFVTLRDSALYALAPLALNALLAIFGLWPAALAGMVLMAASVAIASTWHDAVDGPMERSAARGDILQPEFLPRPLSLRRGIERIYLRSTVRSGNDEQGQSRLDFDPTPFPSAKTVISGHSSSLFELLTFPEGVASNLTAGDRLQSRGLPPNMVEVDNGIFIGIDGMNQPVFLDLEDVHYSLYTAGAPNSGKSNFLLVLFAGVVKAARDHTAGMQLSPIWGETKGEGAYQAWNIARHCPGAVFVDVHNPAGPYRLALEGPRLSDGAPVPTVLANCTRLVSSLQAAYGDGIRSQAREIFDNVLRCAMLMTAEEIESVGLGKDVGINASKPNIMQLASFLLMGDSRTDPSRQMMVLGDVLSRESGDRERALSAAIGSMSRFWNPDTRRTYAERVSTVLNKIDDLRKASLLWTPDHRRDVYVGQFVSRFAPCVVNMGSYWVRETNQYEFAVDRAVSQRLIRSFNYLLWDFIKGNCNGWQEQGRRIPMFFDEVADVAANAIGDDVPNPLEEGTKEGRSRGAAYMLGSQYPSQMPEMVRHQVLASRGKFWFGLQNSSDLDLAVRDLMVGSDQSEGAITPSNIKSLSNGVCFATLPRKATVTPPLLLRVPYAPVWNKMLFAENNSDTNDAVADYMQYVAEKQAG